MINMGVCAFCLVPAMVFAENTHEVTVLNAQQQTRKAVGVVTDKTGEAIIGANVIVKGTTNGTITDMDGRFELDVPNNATLQVSYIGFNTQEIVFTGQPSIEVQLVDDTQALDEVVVTALGGASTSGLSRPSNVGPIPERGYLSPTVQSELRSVPCKLVNLSRDT